MRCSDTASTHHLSTSCYIIYLSPTLPKLQAIFAPTEAVRANVPYANAALFGISNQWIKRHSRASPRGLKHRIWKSSLTMSSKILQMNAQDMHECFYTQRLCHWGSEDRGVRWKLCEMKVVYVTAHIKKKRTLIKTKQQRIHLSFSLYFIPKIQHLHLQRRKTGHCCIIIIEFKSSCFQQKDVYGLNNMDW